MSFELTFTISIKKYLSINKIKSEKNKLINQFSCFIYENKLLKKLLFKTQNYVFDCFNFLFLYNLLAPQIKATTIKNGILTECKFPSST